MNVKTRLQLYARFTMDKCTILNELSVFQLVPLTELFTEDLVQLFLMFSADVEQALNEVDFPLPEEALEQIKSLAHSQTPWLEAEPEIPLVVEVFSTFAKTERSELKAAEFFTEAIYFQGFYILLTDWLLNSFEKNETYELRKQKQDQLLKKVETYLNHFK